MKKKIWTDLQLENAIKNNHSYAGVLKELNLKISGGSHALIKMRIRQLKLDVSHFTGQGWCVGKSHADFIKRFIKIPLEKILVKDSQYQWTNHLKKRLINEKLLDNKCYKCGIDKWLDEPLNLELHHIDGDRCNNLLSNLSLLCPNCHSQTPNYCGKGRRKHKE